MKNNPFKFGVVVKGTFFTDRIEESKKIESFLEGNNHLILSGPRRYGKTSLISTILEKSKRPQIYLDLQMVTGINDMAALLLKRIYQLHPVEKLKNKIKAFRIIPGVSLNPVTGAVDVSFSGTTDSFVALEDVLNLMEKLSSQQKRIICVFDEFQEIFRIDKTLDRNLRSVMQHHKNVNYIFLGSQESIIRDIFEKKKSPFYHFGALMQLNKIPEKEFLTFLRENFKTVSKDADKISTDILEITHGHPHYTQQLAFTVWEYLKTKPGIPNPIEQSIEDILQNHDNDYERLWNTMNSSNRKVLIGISRESNQALSSAFINKYHLGSSSTAFSVLKRLTENGILIKEKTDYLMDDPFFARWIFMRRE